MTERAARFISAYNRIDQTLRSVYRYKPSMSFTDIVRRTAPTNFLVSRYEDTLLDYGRLRNAIVHNSYDNAVIAEPYEETVAEFEKIADLICAPPKAVDVFDAEVRCLAPGTSLKNAILLIMKTGYSNLPVFDGSRTHGVVGNRTLLGQVAQLLSEGADLNTEIEKRHAVPVRDRNYYITMSAKATLPEVCDKFYQNRKLLAVVITPRGTWNERPAAIVTNSDVSRMENILIGYEQNTHV